MAVGAGVGSQVEMTACQLVVVQEQPRAVNCA